MEKAIKEAGFWNPYTDSFFEYSEEKDCSIDAFVEDWLLNHKASSVQTEITRAFDSPGYDCAVLSVAWTDVMGLHLKTFLLESF